MTHKSKKFVIAGVFGNALEWYDFTLYAFFAPILAALFFPIKNTFISLIMTFSVFALGFLVRPIGGIFFGYLGDYFGRRKSLIISIVMMSLPTFLLGLLPTYSTIGLMAPLLLTFLRVIQGTAVSGELTTATAFLVEHADSGKRGWAGSLAMCSGFFGIVISSAMATTITFLISHEQLLSWGWRLPFLLGGLIGLLGLVLRLKSEETLLYQKSERSFKKKPSVFSHLLQLGFKPILIAILITCVMAVGNYLLIGYFNTFLIKNMGLPLDSVMLVNFINLLLLTFLLPLMGILSDKVGRKPLLTTGILGLIIFIFPIFWLLTQHDISKAFYGELLFVIFLAPISAIIPTTLAELFHVHIRNSGIAMGYNISLALFGGTAPLIAIALVGTSKNLFAPAWYFLVCCFVSLLTLIWVKESYKNELN